MSTLALREARRHVNTFTDESEIMQSHQQAMECLDCEAFLQVGIDAFRWLIRADETIRRSIYRGLAQYDKDTDQALRGLFIAWLRPCKIANQWIAVQQGRAYHLDNLDEFRGCEREVLAIVQSMEADQLTDAMRELRDTAVMEHRNGETAEFV
jgi:hypothetical protein